ncbi:hypothetical protein [Mucilaginibacter ginsenosidivorax]|uniref:Uncharacterized protein n=1 Tax=Mucilaginibacter ginsenosidivorax TaxID=862126 RepID=A0A5B8W807_9SPHI|nr:hypothetical protein [Mucilaginibacter ginsenosidivorax]QEC79679.1 hypothetical protein FSB76_28370 [Mucilaginibacter ginsenosidivorax]
MKNSTALMLCWLIAINSFAQKRASKWVYQFSEVLERRIRSYKIEELVNGDWTLLGGRCCKEANPDISNYYSLKS